MKHIYNSYRSIKFNCKTCGLILIALSFSYIGYTQTAPVIKTEADTTQIRIGEQINLKITVDADSAAVWHHGDLGTPCCSTWGQSGAGACIGDQRPARLCLLRVSGV